MLEYHTIPTSKVEPQAEDFHAYCQCGQYCTSEYVAYNVEYLNILHYGPNPIQLPSTDAFLPMGTHYILQWEERWRHPQGKGTSIWAWHRCYGHFYQWLCHMWNQHDILCHTTAIYNGDKMDKQLMQLSHPYPFVLIECHKDVSTVKLRNVIFFTHNINNMVLGQVESIYVIQWAASTICPF